MLLGQRAAALILQRRANDGVQEAFATPYIPLDLPGDYAFTPPYDVPPLGPLAFAPGYGEVTPFGVELSEHGLPGPQSLISVEYALDFAYVKAVGELNSEFRRSCPTAWCTSRESVVRLDSCSVDHGGQPSGLIVGERL